MFKQPGPLSHKRPGKAIRRLRPAEKRQSVSGNQFVAAFDKGHREFGANLAEQMRFGRGNLELSPHILKRTLVMKETSFGRPKR